MSSSKEQAGLWGKIFLFAVGLSLVIHSAGWTFSISREVLEDKIRGGWLGKCAGVQVGAPTEFDVQGAMIQGYLELYPDMGGCFWQDDCYVQVTFIDVMKNKITGAKGPFTATAYDYGEGFKVSSYALWWANQAGRQNLRNGISAPRSGMWGGVGNRYNNVAEAIDWQIESDWAGLMSPGMPQTANAINDSSGVVMNYGDGRYGGNWLGVMIANCFKTYDPSAIQQITEEAIEVVPKNSRQSYKILKAVVDFYNNNPGSDWTECWTVINSNYLHAYSSPCVNGNFNILASFNHAFIALGLMYCEGDIVKGIDYSTRCGQDSDCNPANVGAVMGTLLGYDALPAAWKNSMENYPNAVYSGTGYTFEGICTTLVYMAEKSMLYNGANFNETTQRWENIPDEQACPPALTEFYGFDPVDNPTKNECVPFFESQLTGLQIADEAISPVSPEGSEAVTVSATISDDGSISSAVIKWGTTSGSLTNEVAMSASGDTYTGEIPGQANGVTTYYVVEATDNEGHTLTSSESSYLSASFSATWNSYDIELSSGSPQATLAAASGDAGTADIELYESTDNDGVAKGALFSSYHATFSDEFSNLGPNWRTTEYPYIGKSAVARGDGAGESNTPDPTGVMDLQFHPPENNHLAVCAFVVPQAGSYAVANLGIRRVHSEGGSVSVKLFDNGGTLAGSVSSGSRSWSVDSKTYSVGSMSADDKIYFGVDNVDGYAWDAAEVNWTIKLVAEGVKTVAGMTPLTGSISASLSPNGGSIVFGRADLIGKVSLISLSGRAILKDYTLRSSSLDAGKWQNGIYCLRIRDKDGRISNHKIVKF